MSDAMTNREIEDVLTSIRRLVAQDGGRSTEPGRLILTPAQRIGDRGAVIGRGPAPESDSVSGSASRPIAAEPLSAPASDEGDPSGPDSEPSRADVATPARDGFLLPVPDFSQLEATIAELEAAVSASGTGWENENMVEEAPGPSNVTELYGRLSFQHRAATAEPTAPADDSIEPSARVRNEDGSNTAADAAVDSGASDTSGAAMAAGTVPAGTVPAGAARYGQSDGDETDIDLEPGNPAQDDPATDDLAADDLSEGDETVIDEAMLRALIAQIVREELHGQLGEKITLVVRKLVRSEIAKVLDERKFL